MELSPNAQRDLELVNLALYHGSQKAYADLLYLYRDSVYFMLLRMTRSTIDAEDLTIETFGKAFEKLGDYSSKYAFSTWLYRIAVNNCIDFLRKRSARYSLSNTLSEDDKLEEKILLSPEQQMIDEQQKDYLRQIVSQLKTNYKVLVEMRYFEQKSYEEIAITLNIPLGSVKARLFRAKGLLLNILKNRNAFLNH